MAISRATILPEIADDLNDFGEWSIAANGYLERQLFKAVDDVWKAHQWAFRITSATLTTTTGTLEYAVPADFESLANEEKINKYWAYDAYSVPPSIPDGAHGQRYPIVYNRAANTIVFLCDPGTGDKTLYYLAGLTTLDAALALFPDKIAFKKILASRTSHYALVNTEDFANQAKTYWEQSELQLSREIKRERKGSSRPDTRTTLDTNGNPLYYNFQAGDDQ